jgi:hypothetical protein
MVVGQAPVLVQSMNRLDLGMQCLFAAKGLPTRRMVARLQTAGGGVPEQSRVVGTRGLSPVVHVRDM